MGTPGRLAHYAQLAVRPPAERKGPMPAFLFNLETQNAGLVYVSREAGYA